MKSTTITVFFTTAVLAGCASNTPDKIISTPTRDTAPAASPSKAPSVSGSSALTLSGYKRDVARHISSTNSTKIYSGRPQALLRSVVVMKYTVDGSGQLVRSEILRSNHDDETETIAMRSLRSATPLPRPDAHLLRNGQLEVIETWLFNDDGRFQLRTIALPQMDN
jgi:protein TonB